MLTTKYLLLIIFYTKFQIPLFFKKKIKIFLFFYEKVLTLSFTFGIVSFVAREKIKNPVKCDMRKCRNWQTSKTKDLVSIALVWVQVPSSALKNEELCEFMVPYFFAFISNSVCYRPSSQRGDSVASSFFILSLSVSFLRSSI